MRPRMSLVMSAGAIILLALVSGPASAQTPTVLFNFDGTHGEFPSGSLTLRPDGLTLYGMAHFGGAGGYGTIFSLPSIGGTPTVLFPFDSTHGSYPFYGSLTLSPDGLTLYGMTYYGGASEHGTVFSLPTIGGTPTVLFSFDGTHGSYPYGSLTLSGSTMYGMTHGGGAGGYGTIFSLPAIGGTPTVLFSFDGTHGSYPYGSLTLSGSTLYGMASGGGNMSLNSGLGFGTIFSLPAIGGTPTILFSFDGPHGAYPYVGDLTLSGSTLYGMTYYGGDLSQNFGQGYGAIFSIPITGGTPTVLFSFDGTHGSYPRGDLTLRGSTLYGMTSAGGNGFSGAGTGNGLIFSIPITGGTPTVLFPFDSTHGLAPWNSLTLGGSTLYGMTHNGGANNEGVVFGLNLPTLSVSASTDNTWVYQNTPVNTCYRNHLTLTLLLPDTWGNSHYTVTVGQSGSGAVIASSTFIENVASPSPSEVVMPIPAGGLVVAAAPVQTLYLIGGPVYQGLALSAANLALTGSCTVTVTVVGDVSGVGNQATATVTITVRPLGDITGSGQVGGNDRTVLDNRLNAFNLASYTTAECDLSGDGYVTAADRVLLNKILNGLAVP